MKDGVAADRGPRGYAQPANLHVARFMGYRNVLELDVADGDGERVALSGPTSQLPACASSRSRARAAVAIRPEEIIVTEGTTTNTIAGRVDNVEYCAATRCSTSSPRPERCCTRGAVSIRRGDSVRVHDRPSACWSIPWADRRLRCRICRHACPTLFDRALLLVVWPAALCFCYSSIHSFMVSRCRSIRRRAVPSPTIRIFDGQFGSRSGSH